MTRFTLNLIKIVLTLAIIAVIGVYIPSLGQLSTVTVPKIEKHMDGTETESTVNFVAGVSCPDFWWDFVFKLSSEGIGKGTVSIEDSNGNSEVVAGFTSDSNGNIVYSDWHAGAYVWHSDNQWDVFSVGRIVDKNKTVDISFEMQQYSNFIWNHGCTKIVLKTQGELQITPVSTATMIKPGMVCASCEPLRTCATICMRDNFWWWSRRDELSRYRVAQFGVNFGNELVASNPNVIAAIRNNTDNGATAVFQLQFQRQQSLPQDAGWAECYNVNFEEFTVFDSDRVTVTKINTKTYLFEINRLLKVSIKNNNPVDFAKLVKVARIMNDVHNCPQ